MVEVDPIYRTYLEAPSMREAARRLGMDQWKLRRLRDLNKWPRKSHSLQRKNGLARRGLDTPRAYGRSIYDSIITGDTHET